MKNKLLSVYGSIILSMLFWSLSFVWVKIVYQVYNPITTVFLRLLISTVFLLIITYFSNKLQSVDRKDRKELFALSLFQPFLYFMCESFGLKYVSSTIGAVIISTIPLFTPIAAYFFFREKISRTNIMGLIISFLGVAIITLNKKLSLTASPLGISLLFLAVVSAVGYSTVLKRLTNKYNTLTITTHQNLIGIFLFLPFFLIFDLDHFMKSTPTNESITALLMLAIFASSLAFIFFTYGIKHIGITKSNTFANIIPVFTAFFAFYILNETLSTQKIIGITTVITGLFLSQSKIKFKFKRVTR